MNAWATVVAAAVGAFAVVAGQVVSGWFTERREEKSAARAQAEVKRQELRAIYRDGAHFLLRTTFLGVNEMEPELGEKWLAHVAQLRLFASREVAAAFSRAWDAEQKRSRDPKADTATAFAEFMEAARKDLERQ